MPHLPLWALVVLLVVGSLALWVLAGEVGLRVGLGGD